MSDRLEEMDTVVREERVHGDDRLLPLEAVNLMAWAVARVRELEAQAARDAAVVEAAAQIVQHMTPIEHPKSPTDYAYSKVTNEQWRALVAAVAPLLEDVDQGKETA